MAVLARLDTVALIACNAKVLVIFVLISQTGVGLLQRMIERLDTWQVKRNGKTLGRAGHGLIAGAMVVISMASHTMGIVALIFRGQHSSSSWQ